MSSDLPEGFEIRSGWDAEWLLLNHADEAAKLLRWYHSLLSDDRPWWRRCIGGNDPRWPDCFRAALRAVAIRSSVEPAHLARMLGDDDGSLPQVRALIIATARRICDARASA